MKKFVLTTQSQSGDHYVYFIEHPKEPTAKELGIFLEEHANDKDAEFVYEFVDACEEIKDFLKIPKNKI